MCTDEYSALRPAKRTERKLLADRAAARERAGGAETNKGSAYCYTADDGDLRPGG